MLQGNLIGTDAAGTKAIRNDLGINVEGGDDNLIGGTAAGEGNVISGSFEAGVQIEAGDPDDGEAGEEPGPATGNEL